MITERFLNELGIKAAVFDMDGTLTDSMSAWTGLYEILFDRLGLKTPSDFLMKVNHLPMQRRMDVIVELYSVDIDPVAVYEWWYEQIYDYYLNVFKVKPYTLDALNALKKAGVRMAVATASDKRLVDAFVRGNSLDGYFAAATDLTEVSRPKSSPDIYLKSARKLGVTPDECLVFEDTLIPIKAAKSGGFRVCGVRDDCSASDADEIIRLSDMTLGFDLDSE